MLGETKEYQLSKHQFGRTMYYVNRCIRQDDGYPQPAIWFTLIRRVGFGKWEHLGSFARQWQATRKLKELTNG